jgi:hypothetical protein
LRLLLSYGQRMDGFRTRSTVVNVTVCLLFGALTICGVAYAATRLADNRVERGSAGSEKVADREPIPSGPRIATAIGRAPRRVNEARPAPPSPPAREIAERRRAKPVPRRAVGFRVAITAAGDRGGPSGSPTPVALPVAAAGSLQAQPADEAPPQPAPELAEPEKAIGEPSSIYWGAAIDDPQTGTQAPWNMGLVTEFEEAVGKPLSLVHLFSPFADCSHSPCSFYKFPTGAMENIRRYGAIPFFSWASDSIPTRLNEPNFQLADVIAGSYDSYIREFAQAARLWAHPFFLRFNWEMNGNWFPWSEGVNGNQPGEFVAAWRHVHDIFTSVGATATTRVPTPSGRTAGAPSPNSSRPPTTRSSTRSPRRSRWSSARSAPASTADPRPNGSAKCSPTCRPNSHR